MTALKKAKIASLDESRGDNGKTSGSKVDQSSADGMKASDAPSFSPSIVGAGKGHQSTTPSSSPTDLVPDTGAAADREERIRHKAYLLWLEEGQPNDRGSENWLRAEAEVDAEDADEDSGHFA